MSNTPVPAIDWLEWTDAAFARARDARQAVLLFLRPSWCAASRHMEATTWRDPAVAGRVTELFVPVRVDAERHPDISDRYSLGGWPTTAFLTSEGELLGGGTYFEPERLAGLLLEVVRAVAGRRGEIARLSAAAARHRATAAEAPGAAPDEPGRAAGVIAQLRAGLTSGALPPALWAGHPDALHLALSRLEDAAGDAGREPWAGGLQAVMERLIAGLADPIEGGFHRCVPAGALGSEKLLGGNARLLRVCLRAWRAAGWEACREAAAGILAWARARMDAPGGGFFASQAADAAYYGLPPAARMAAAPAVDRALYVDANALMVSACLDAGATFGDPSLVELGVSALERVVPEAYRPGLGLAHVASPDGRRGLLADQVLGAAALLDAEEPTGRRPYGELAEELMEYAGRVLWDEEAGAFCDRPATGADAIGLLGEPFRPVELNCKAARTLVALAASSGETRFLHRARRIVEAMAPLVTPHGLDGAAWVRARDAVRGRPW